MDRRGKWIGEKSDRKQQGGKAYNSYQSKTWNQWTEFKLLKLFTLILIQWPSERHESNFSHALSQYKLPTKYVLVIVQDRK